MAYLHNEQRKVVHNFIIVPAPKTLDISAIYTQPTPPQQKEAPSQIPVQPEATISLLNRKKYPKDDYQKNITINVVKCCIRQMLSSRFKTLLKKKCEKINLSYEELKNLVEPILKEVVISLGDLKNMLTNGSENEQKLKKVFCWFLEWYLRNRYMYYLLNEGKMNHKERYIEYKNKYMLYLLKLIRENKDLNSPIRSIPTQPLDNKDSQQ